MLFLPGLLCSAQYGTRGIFPRPVAHFLGVSGNIYWIVLSDPAQQQQGVWEEVLMPYFFLQVPPTVACV